MESHQRDHENYVACSRNRRRRAKALLDFERHDDDELGFRKNDIITVCQPRGQAPGGMCRPSLFGTLHYLFCRERREKISSEPSWEPRRNSWCSWGLPGDEAVCSCECCLVGRSHCHHKVPFLAAVQMCKRWIWSNPSPSLTLHTELW